jgi:hypothetical protein
VSTNDDGPGALQAAAKILTKRRHGGFDFWQWGYISIDGRLDRMAYPGKHRYRQPLTKAECVAKLSEAEAIAIAQAYVDGDVS